MSLWYRVLPLLAILAVASCRAEGEGEPITKKSVSTDPSVQSLVDAARSDLLERLKRQGVSEPEVVVLQAERVTWRSGALGCPMPDRGYTMVLTPGVLIRLRAESAVYEYHSSPRGPVFLCEPPGTIETPAPNGYTEDPT